MISRADCRNIIDRYKQRASRARSISEVNFRNGNLDDAIDYEEQACMWDQYVIRWTRTLERRSR